jgi:hypothetical protein
MQVEDYALDLRDFHEASRQHPIIPILVATEASPRPQTLPLLIGGVADVLCTSAGTMPSLLTHLAGALPLPATPLDVAGWEWAPYRPVPTIIEAAQMLYARHNVAEIAAARADVANLNRTTDAIRAAIAEARMARRHTALFVTGIPGAGKTLCGLNAAFSLEDDTAAAFLTGNPTLVHVLREALARNAAGQDRTKLHVARRRAEARIQALPRFRDHYAAQPDEIPPEHVVVIDEAQRSWSREHAIRKTRDRAEGLRLTDSEPGHLLDAMGRHADWAVIDCLIGNGQEIHTGEGGLAEWGHALAARPQWQVRTAPDALTATDALQRLPPLPGLRTDPSLHLDVPVRAIRGPSAATWVEAVLRGDADQARQIAADAESGVPFLITRELAAMRAALRASCRGSRRAGLVASSGAARLRADGLGAELPHMDADAVAHWFLDRWPEDVRASDALEQVATEFCCQGLELDAVGLCWGGDLIRVGAGWQTRTFRGTDWQINRKAEAIAYRMNTYRVLLTRARYETIIWIPPGDRADRTRNPAMFDDIADFLLSCGAHTLGDVARESAAPATALL